FPALPAGWKDVAFDDLRAEGAFLVSAVRRGGKTVLVKVHSLAGEPAVLKTDLADAELVGPAGKAQKQSDGSWKLTLARGETLVLQARGSSAAERAVGPVGAKGDRNAYGLR